MATLPKNNIVRSVAPKSLFDAAKNVINATNDWNQGDLLAFASGVLYAVSATGDSTKVCGVARQTVVDGKVKSPYQGTAVDASASLEEIAGPVYGVVAEMKLNSGDSFTPGCKVYLTAVDAQTITSSDPGDGKHIGIYQGVSLTAGASSVGDVLIGARYGLDGIGL